MRWLDEACRRTWFRRYLKLLAVVLVYGATVHVGNILGLSGTPWSETPLHFRVLDVVLLAFDLVVAVGLWRARPLAIVAFVAGIIALQIVPYLLFTSAFATTADERRVLYGLIGTEVALLVGLLVAYLARK